MLGTNDAKDAHGLTDKEIVEHLEQTIKLIQEEGVGNTTIVCPPGFVLREDGTPDERFVSNYKIFDTLPALFKEVSEKHHCRFLNAGDYIVSSKIDGFHLDPGAHQTLVKVLSEEILR